MQKIDATTPALHWVDSGVIVGVVLISAVSASSRKARRKRR
ncbi:MAG TPA: hypothetical protein VFB20_06940 [Burkholderiales bacterium]|nr:hypothetical protein [Burkholderiales bacterium]